MGSARTHTRVQRRQLQKKKKNPKIDEVAAAVASGRRQVSVSAASLIFAVPVSTRQPSVTKPAGPVRLSLSALLELEHTATPQGGASVWFFFGKRRAQEINQMFSFFFFPTVSVLSSAPSGPFVFISF